MATVSKNIFWSSLTSVLQLYTGSVVFIVLAKLMSVEHFGILSFGFSLSALVVIVSDFGFSLMVMKDFPAEKDHKNYLSSSVLAKVCLALCSAVGFFIYLIIFYKGEWLLVGGIYVIFAIIASFTIYFQALLRVQNRFKKYTESGVVYAMAVTLAVIAYWKFDISLIELVLCLLGCKAVQLLWTIFICRSSFQGMTLKSARVSELLSKSWSFGLFGILGIFYFMVDTQLISIFLGAREVALYQSVFRIVLILMVFSDIISNVLLPYLSFKFYNKENISQLVSRLFLFLLIIGCSWFLLFTSFKTEILKILYTHEYIEAAVLVVPFSIVIVLRTVSTLLGNILTISDRQTYRVITVGVSLCISLTLNLLLIPIYGIIAAAWTSVVVHFILFGMYFIYCKKEVPSMNLFPLASILVLLTTLSLFLVVTYFGNGNLWTVIACILVWLLAIILIMKRNDNIGFLRMVLREKGVG